MEALANPQIRVATFWGYFVVALLAFIFALIIGGVANTAYDNNRPSYGLQNNTNVVLWAIALFVLLLGAYYGTICGCDAVGVASLGGLFLLQLFFFIAFFFVFQRFGDFNNSLWALIILFILGLLTLAAVCWNGFNQGAAILIIIWLVWLGYQIAVVWDLIRRTNQQPF